MTDFDNCPHCGRTVMKGAMRCVGCGRILKSPEEQLESIRKIRETPKGFNPGGIIRLCAFLLAAGLLYYYFSDAIHEFLGRILGN